METYITICKIDSQWEFVVSGNSNRGSVSTCLRVDTEGWDGEGDGREVQEGGDMCILMADSC